MGFTLKSSGTLAAKLQSMRSSAQSGAIGGKLTVPPDMKWWYYHEFGTASPYSISPISGQDLRLPITPEHPEPTYVPEVGPPHTELHPPIAARHMVGRVLDDIMAYAAQVVGVALSGDFNLENARAALMSDALPHAVEIIADSFEEQLPGTSDEGRLQGESAASAFLSAVQIEPL